jgi:teichuronic acid biosynthesis glycosyltransferase TuaC
MKLLYIVSSYPSEVSSAGNFYQRTAEALIKHGVEVCVITFVPKTLFLMSFFSKTWNNYRYMVNRDEIINDVRVVRLGYFGLPLERIWARPDLFMFSKARRFIEKNKIEFDIIDANYSYPYCLVGEMISSFYDKPLIATLRGSDVNIDAFRGSFGRHRFVSGIKGANRIHVVSAALMEKVESIYPNRRTSIMNVGLNLSRLNSFKNTDKTSSKISLGWNGFHVIFVGSLTYMKGVDLLLSTIMNPKFSDLTWHFVGIGQYEKQLSKIKVAKLHFHLDNDSTIKLIYASDLMILPSRGEGMPNVLKEAGAMGTPILASDVGGIPEFLNHGLYGTMFKSGDLAELNINLQNILDNYQMALEKAKYLFDYVTDKYDIHKNSRVLADIYKKEITY